MSPAQFQRVKQLFDEVEALPPDRRDSAIAAARAEDPIVGEQLGRMFARMSRQHAVKFEHQVARQIDRVLASVTSPASPSPEAMIGRRVGPYEIQRLLGQGGMGVVYLGRDTQLGRLAALKSVRCIDGLHDAATERKLVDRLKREAMLLASLSHPNLATVYGLEESEDADGSVTLFIALEYIDGPTLGKRLARRAMSIPEALSACAQIAAGVEAAHEAGVIHRDLKPENVLFTGGSGSQSTSLKVLDFGLARQCIVESKPADGASTIAATPTRISPPHIATRAGARIGTPGYMSPEQIRGEPLDVRSDIFTFGLILYRCLTGEDAFNDDEHGDVTDAILHREPDFAALPARVPASVRSILKRCLAKTPADRYRHIGDVRLDLLAAVAARDWERRDAVPGRRSLVRWVATLAAVALIGGGAAYAVYRATKPMAVAPAAAQRFDILFPDDAPQGDWERLQLARAPDGSSLIVACQTPERGQSLWIRSDTDGRWRPIEGSSGAHRPIFARDGRSIGFFRDGHFWRHPLSGEGDAIRLGVATNWYGADWGEGSDRDALALVPAWGSSVTRSEPSPRNAADPVTTGLTTLQPDEVSHVSPFVVPGTRWMLVTVWSGGDESAVFATNLDTLQRHRVLANAGMARVATTPKGDQLLFERGSVVYAMRFDRTTATVSGSETPIAEGVMNDVTRFAAYFDAGADGTFVYIPGGAFNEQSRVAYVDGVAGPTTPLNDDRMSFSEPAISGDGRRLAVFVKGKVYRLLVYDLQRGTGEFLLTGGDTIAHALSPDGATIACTVNRDGGYGVDLYSLTNGTFIRRLVAPGADYPSDLDWTRDGRFITFSMSYREGAARDVWMVDAQANGDQPAEPRQLVATRGTDSQAAVSPDSGWAAYTSDVSGRQEVYVTSVPDGRRTRQVSVSGGTSPRWSPDGRSIVYRTAAGLVRITFDPTDGSPGGDARVIYDKPFGQSDPIGRDFTIAPDGRPLIIEPSERRPRVSRLCVITNWWSLLP